MSRPIKFRAWHKEIKYMSPVGTICFDNWVEIYIPEQIPPNGEVEWQGGQVRLNELELMQFTGLHDKNGKEIYEYDIVKFSCVDYPEKANIVFKDGAFREDYYGYTLPKSDFMEVLGNVFENPNLLKAGAK